MIKWGLVVILTMLIGSDSNWTSNQQRWFASFAGDPKAQLQIANLLPQRSASFYWRQQAATNGSLEALEQLKRQYPSQRLRWLKLGTALGDGPSIYQYAKYQLDNDGVSWSDWLNKWHQPEYQQPLANYFKVIETFIRPDDTCHQTIPVVAAAASEKSHFIALLQESLELGTPLANGCFKFVVEADLRCESKGGERAHCTGAAVSQSQQQQILLAKRGKASSTPNTIILSRDSDASVLAHELAHWWGFADEYAMRPALAQAFCNGHYPFSPVNLVITDTKTMTTEQLKNLADTLPWKDQIGDWRSLATRQNDGRWKLGSRDKQVGLFRAKTCDNVAGVTAWKPVSQVTAMENHKTNVWPLLYQQLIQNYKANAN
ncbi:hypothetical protein [Idiomarina seosinensis]|uniref:Peptidase n=1 Tax=Idiomarina seosinensis TaxID=281739 RepID=A0A432ZH34_9GAMM|nr:hypothetical protein [Idiomarina seosinensis]RUO77213.1 hypothetical protein CWI81_01585 [Idiomarina seosinensis]